MTYPFRVAADGRGGFVVAIGTSRKEYRAENVREVTRAVEHYFGRASGHLGKHRACPLCRAMRDEARAKAPRAARRSAVKMVNPFTGETMAEKPSRRGP